MMTLKELLEEQSVKAISKKTNISEENIERMIAEDFAALAKPKALGFISIFERDLGVNLQSTREKAYAYYEEHSDESKVNIALPRIEEKRGRSKLFLLLMLGLLAYASWYFFTKFDKKMLGTMLPFTEEKVPAVNAPSVNDAVNATVDKVDKEEEASLSITNALTRTQEDAAGVQTDIVVASLDPNETQQPMPQAEIEAVQKLDVNAVVQNDISVATPAISVTQIVLKPQKRLWFGLIDIASGKRDNYTISDKFMIDVKEKSWLVATSSAAFSFINKEEIQEYNDAQEHYFKVSKAGVESLNKAEYITLGGYRKW